MAITAENLDLGPDEFAFYFETNGGVDADALANFLKRAATFAKQRGSNLQVVGLRQGSLAVVIKVIQNSKIGQGAAKEFSEKPIDTTIKVSGSVAAIAAGIVSAIVYAMSPDHGKTTPLAKSGAEIVEKHKVNQITIVSNTNNTIIMNQSIASEIREAERDRYPMLPQPERLAQLPPPVAAMIEDARRGELSGDATLVGGELHFRPDGYRYWVPVDIQSAVNYEKILPGKRFRISGRIATRDGQPDRIVVNQAEPID